FYMELPNTPGKYPVYPGYSNIGEVVAVGEEVTQFSVGDVVASGTAHASHTITDQTKAVHVPEGLVDEHAVFFNLVAIAMQGVHKARIDLGESAAIIGAGLIGLFAMRLAQLSGGIPVTAVDLDQSRLDLAQHFVADEILNVSEDNWRDSFANVVIEASGAPPAVNTAFQLAAQRGRVVLLGSSRGITSEVNFYRDVHRKGLTVIGAHELNRPSHDETPGFYKQVSEWRTALQLMQYGRLDIKPLISYIFGAADFSDAYEQLKARDPKTLGMVIDWT
ncbi:MAG: zinc-binding alcohol dehydrogenase, partial [Chloroflexota bacterium]